MWDHSGRRGKEEGKNPVADNRKILRQDNLGINLDIM